MRELYIHFEYKSRAKADKMKEHEKELNELKAFMNVKTDIDLAKALNVTLPAINNWKRRGLSSDMRAKLLEMKTEKLESRIDDIAVEKKRLSQMMTIEKLSAVVGAGFGSVVESIDSVERVGQLVLDSSLFKTSQKSGNLFAMQVDGNSMYPMIPNEAWVIFEGVERFVGDGLYVVNWRNILMVKLLQVNSEGQIRIISVNKDYESYTVEADDQSVFRIFGKVLKTIS